MLQPSALQAVELLDTSFWKCFSPLPQNESGFISFRIGMSLEGKTFAFKRELPDLK